MYDRLVRDYIYTTLGPTEKVYVPTLSGIDETGKSSDGNKKNHLLGTAWIANKENIGELWRDKLFNSPQHWIVGRYVGCGPSVAGFGVTYCRGDILVEEDLCVTDYYTNSYMIGGRPAYVLRVISTLDLASAPITKNASGEWIIK